MAGYVYPTVAEAIEIHRQLIEEFGGSREMRDKGRLEAAIFRPQTGYYNDLIEEAAALMESLANNNAFMDGNKRVSFTVADTFLRLNGFYIEIDSVAAHEFITQTMGRGEFRFAVIRDWLCIHVRPLSEGML